jgi:N-acetylglutamate synthase
VKVDGDTAAQTLTAAWRALVDNIPAAWAERRGGAQAAVTTVQVPTLNCVWTEDVAADPEAVASFLARIRDERIPHCLQIRPGAEPALGDLAGDLGMVKDEALPLMVLEGRESLPETPAELVIRELDPVQAPLHASVAAAGFGVPEEPFRALMLPSVLNGQGVRCYLGEVDGEPVTTGVGVTEGEAVGIFNIATPPHHRRHGYGAAITARAVRDGMTHGARWAWLQSSELGYPTYARLGFRTVEAWETWVTPTG